MHSRQQQILEDFIERSKDHLSTIEHGVLNLQSTIQDRESLNEILRATSSVKASAAMLLGLGSIQRVAYLLEGFFVRAREPIRVDDKLEALCLQLFDALQQLFVDATSYFGLTDETVAPTVATAETVFLELEQYLDTLAGNPPTSSSHTAIEQAELSQQSRSRSLVIKNDKLFGI